MLKVPDVGEPLLLSLLRTALNAEGLVVRLFRNDKTPADGDYTEANFDGYAALDLENFGTPASDGNGRSRVQADAVVFEKRRRHLERHLWLLHHQLGRHRTLVGRT